MGINNCPICLEKQREIDSLKEEVDRLRQALGREKRKANEGLFGSSTSSGKRPVKQMPRRKKSRAKEALDQAIKEAGANPDRPAMTRRWSISRPRRRAAPAVEAVSEIKGMRSGKSWIPVRCA